jgi:hypothetical protein
MAANQEYYLVCYEHGIMSLGLADIFHLKKTKPLVTSPPLCANDHRRVIPYAFCLSCLRRFTNQISDRRKFDVEVEGTCFD